ncbi:MAG: DUF975 family protein [Lachnospiraceae bacterium]|nr:DUF975 family protein [Lachnospiraceae bacterium]MDD3659695.1 DUF975 family protein [Lachnospiraceae bacterium]
MLTRAELKQRAKDSMSTASIHPVLVTLVFLLITFAVTGIISFISTIITSAIGFTSALAADYETVAVGGMLAMMPVTMILSLISFAITCVLQTGYLAYTLKTIRHQESGLEELFHYFKPIVKLFCLYFMVQLFTALWSLLFVIPGIIASYRYRMAVYLYLDDPDKGILDCIRESKEMMIGHKFELFVLDLSFILWILLCAVTCGLAALYVTPYATLTNSVYYDNLKYITSPQPVESAAEFVEM